MSYGICPSCKAPGFPAKVGGIFQCAYCGTRGSVPAGQVECSECDSPAEHEEHVRIQVAKKQAAVAAELQAAMKAAARKRARRNILAFAALIASAWFFCIAPTMRWFQREGISMRELVPTAAPLLSQAQIEATRQAETDQLTALFESFEATAGEVTERWAEPYDGMSTDHKLYASFPLNVENNGASFHSVLIKYRCRDNAWNWSGWGPERYALLGIPAGQSLESVVSCQVGYSIRGEYGWDELPSAKIHVRIEEVDGVSRQDTDLRWDREWDWILTIVDDAPSRDYLD